MFQGRESTSGSSADKFDRSPDALSTASDHVVRPSARSIHVGASISTTAGGVPRVCRAPSMHCTTANGGTRTSTDAPG